MIADLQREVSARLRDAGIESPEAEARWIVDAAAGEAASDPGFEVTSLVIKRVDEMVRRRIAGEPLQYVIGAWQFRGVDLFVDKRVLIPRPETEVTAQMAIDAARRLGADGVDAEFVVVDLGTGSGAIALSLADELPDEVPELAIWATDASEAALAVARANFAGAGSIATRIRVAHGHWFAALPDELRGHVRVVVANPPYIAEAEVEGLPREVIDFEPYEALVSGPTGLEAVQELVVEAPEWLAPGGALVIEISPPQAEAVMRLASQADFADVRVEQDLTGRDRVLVAHLP